MKKTFQYISAIIFTFSMVLIFSSCTKDDDGGTPRIDYVRITAPGSSDSLIVSAGQGQLIAIIGENLGGTRTILFNNVPAVLTSTYITQTSILVSVPVDIPTDLTNTLTIFFANGDSLVHDFNVAINKPSVTGMKSEYVNDGGVATIYGDYFYPPLKVIFPNNLEVDVDANSIAGNNRSFSVKVPAGAAPGQISVKSDYGVGKSTFMFRDNRNIVISSDPVTGWWDYAVTNPGTGDPEKINGNYIRITQQISAWGWTDIAGGPADAMGDICKNIPDEAILHPELYSLKFEINTIKPFNGGGIRIILGLTDPDLGSYTWNPPYDTKGKWETVTIPYKEMVDAYVAGGSTMAVSHDGYWPRITIFGGTPLDCDICFDNFRIVPDKY